MAKKKNEKNNYSEDLSCMWWPTDFAVPIYLKLLFTTTCELVFYAIYFFSNALGSECLHTDTNICVCSYNGEHKQRKYKKEMKTTKAATAAKIQ